MYEVERSDTTNIQSEGFGFTGGRVSTTMNYNGDVIEQKLEVDLNGYAKKNSFSEMYREDPFRFFVDYVGFLSTIRHELIHAKDPLAIAQYGTSAISNRYGHMQYVNDPARLEIRSAMGEWDILLSEIQNIIKNKDKDKYHKEVYFPIKAYLCDFQKYFSKAEDKAQALFKFLTEGLGRAFVPKELANRLKLYHDFWSVSDGDAKKSIRLYEKAMKPTWKKVYDDKMILWLELSTNEKE